MRALGVILSSFAALAMLFALLDASILAQGAKDEKKSEEKKTEQKKVEKKVRLADPYEVNRAKKKVGKIKEYRSEEPAEIVVVLADPARIPEFNEWLVRTKKDILGMKDAKARFEKIKHFDAEKSAEYNTKVYTGEEIQVPVNEHVRVILKDPPKTYDDNNKEKKLTSTQLSALKAPSPLQGYTSSATNLKAGQIVELYLKPTPPAPKAAPTTTPKKGPIGADPKDTGPIGATKAEVYLIRILQEP